MGSKKIARRSGNWYNAPKKLQVEKSMGMSFPAPCPQTEGLSVPRKSGPAGAFLRGHETKKDIPMLKVQFLSCITLMRHSASSSWPRGSVGAMC
jgi:hypothetical protein